jgi:hypothetical protein
VQSVVLVLRSVEEYCSFAVEGYLAIPPTNHLLVALYLQEFLFAHLIQQTLKVFLANVAEQQIVEGTDVGVWPLADDVDSGVGVEEMLDGREELLALLLICGETLDLHELLELLLDFEVLDGVLLV